MVFYCFCIGGSLFVPKEREARREKRSQIFARASVAGVFFVFFCLFFSCKSIETRNLSVD